MSNAPTITAAHARTLADTLLDQAYVKTATPVIAAIEDSSGTRLIQRRLTELRAEQERVAASGKSMDSQNPVLRAFIADLDTWLKRIAALIDATAPAIQRSGIDAAGPISTALALPGVSPAMASEAGWQLPNPDDLEATIDFTAKSSWHDKLDTYAAAIVAVALGIVARDVESDPKGMIDSLAEMVSGLPRSQADTLMRTLQLEAERNAQRAIAVANADLVVTQIRIAQLDDRTCMACIALHGTEVPLGDPIEEHPNGRCQGVLVIHGRDYSVDSGADYFDALDEADQQSLMGPANYSAYQAGKVNLQDFVHRYTDDTFGPMLRQASLKGMLGDSAQNYYRNKGQGN